MADLTKKQYLDLAGLKAFWGIIKDKFVSDVTLAMGDTGAAFTATFGDGDTKTIGVIPMATKDQAGLMSAAQAATVDSFSDGVAALIPLTAVKVNGTAAELADRAVNLDFIYDSTAKEIQVVDKNNANAVLTKIDATAFIKDGMVSDVRLDGNNLVIDFNTDHGKEDIALPLDKFIDIYEGTNGVKVDGKVISIVTNGDYLVADAAGLKVADALWTEVGRLDTAVATAAATDATNKANAAQAAAEAKADELATAAKEAAEATAATLAGNAETNAKKYTDDRLGDLGKVDEADQTVKGYVDAAIEAVVGTNGSLADVLQNAKDYTDEKIGDLPAGTTVVDAIDAAKEDAKGYADSLKTAIDGVIEENEKVTAEALNDHETRINALEAIEHEAYKDYVDGKIGTLADGATTVATAIENAQNAAQGYADTVAGNVYAAIEAIPLTEITLDKLNA